MNAPMSEMVALVRQFHERAGYEYESSPSVSNADRRKLWLSMIAEEYNELTVALEAEDLVATADGIADSLYVLIGAALAFALPIDEIFSEVHRSNMSKVESLVARRGDGKILRSDKYEPPQIARILASHLK